MKTRNEQIMLRAERHGSAATTVLGAAQFLLRHQTWRDNAPFDTKKPKLDVAAHVYRCREMLNTAPIGTMLEPEKRVDGWRFLPLADPELCAKSLEQARAENPRKQHLYEGSPTIGGKPFAQRWENIDYKGSFKGWRGSKLFADYQSAIGISRSGRTAVIVQGNKLLCRLLAPTGLRWELDNEGALLCRVSDGLDYHPSLEDLRSPTLSVCVRHGLAEAAKRRRDARKLAREQAKYDRLISKAAATTRVTLEDSRRAVNCVEGSIIFAVERLGMSRAEIVACPWLVSVSAKRLLATRDPRAAAAARQAWARETMVQI
jgi:hypothetical protein